MSKLSGLMMMRSSPLASSLGFWQSKTFCLLYSLKLAPQAATKKSVSKKKENLSISIHSTNSQSIFEEYRKLDWESLFFHYNDIFTLMASQKLQNSEP